MPDPPPRNPTTADYLRYVGIVFQGLRGDKSVSEIVREMHGRISRGTIERLERGASDVTVRSQIELATFYGLTLADLHRKTWELLGWRAGEAASGGNLTITLSPDDRDLILRALAAKNRHHP